MMELPKNVCPRCGDPIPNAEHVGEYPGATSRTDNATEVCSYCGLVEAMEQFSLGAPLPQSMWPAVNRWLQREAENEGRSEGDVHGSSDPSA